MKIQQGVCEVDECRKYGLTETDLVANSQPRPDSENQNNDQEAGKIEEDNQGTARPVSTLPRNVNTEIHKLQENVRKFGNTTRRMQSYEEEVKFITISRVFESFIETTPQLVLQIYIVLMTKQFPLFTVISCAGSLLALSTTMFSTQRYFRAKKTQTQLSIPASFVIFCWRACTILSRVLVFGLFLTVRPHLFLVGIILHWVVATVLVTKESTGKWISGVTDMLSYGILYGIILIFCFIDTGVLQPIMEIKPRLKMFIFYAVVVIENVGVSYWWYLTQLRSHTGFLLGNLSSTFSNETSTGFLFGILSSTFSNETSTSLLFGNLSSTLSNETIVENELFPTESAGIFEKQHAFIILVAVHGLFLLGMLFMIVYYQVLHPIKV